MSHVVLLGDSIFDNALYVPGGEPVIAQLRSRLPRGDRATLLAVDGSVVASVARQLDGVPEDATHLVLSTGGNDALEHSAIINERTASARDVFRTLARVHVDFMRAYREMLRAVRALRWPTAICTIYDAVPGLQAEAIAALSIFNDAILRIGVEAGVPIIDLRLVCNEARDYSAVSPIEPSEIGGAKIASSIAAVVARHDFTRGESIVYR